MNPLRWMPGRRSLALGIALAGLTIGGLAHLSIHSRPLWTGLLGVVVAAIYIGWGLADGRPFIVGVEIGFAAAIVALAGIGASVSPVLLAVALFVHAGWDALHHREVRLIRTAHVPEWYPPVCMIYDVLVGAAVLVLLRS